MSTVAHALQQIWQALALPEKALRLARLEGADPVLPSSFAVGAAAQAWAKSSFSLKKP